MISLTPKTLTFPLRGVARRGNYRNAEPPYTTPFAVNVRGQGSLEGRWRGGSRSGLRKVADVSKLEVQAWEWPNGEPIQWGDKTSVTFAQTSYGTPDGTSIFQTTASLPLVVEKGEVPSDFTHSVIYRSRMIVAKDNLWYASRAGDFTDWDSGYYREDPSRPITVAVGSTSRPADHTITALFNWRDSFLFIATRNGLYAVQGDVIDGPMQTVSEYVGVIAPWAWAVGESQMAFLSNDGIYLGSVGEAPQRFSEELMPKELRNVDTDDCDVFMAWDQRDRGFHLFIVNKNESSLSHGYWLDIDNHAIWPVQFANEDHWPKSIARIVTSGIEKVAFLGQDDEWRTFEHDAEDDDGTAIESYVVIGALNVAANDIKDSLLAEVHGVLAETSGVVTYHLSVGHSAEETIDKCLEGEYFKEGEWPLAKRNLVDRVRARSPWVSIAISADSPWAYEAIVLKSRQLGRLRR